MTLPTDAKARKDIPLSWVLDYFPDALCALAKLIVTGQKQHGTLGWDRSKSGDHDDCLLRHFMERGTIDTDGVRHRTKVVIRSLMALQLEIEEAEGLPPSRGSVSLPKQLEFNFPIMLDLEGGPLPNGINWAGPYAEEAARRKLVYGAKEQVPQKKAPKRTRKVAQSSAARKPRRK